MNQKSNLLIFVLASVAMLFGYSWLIRRNAEQEAARAARQAAEQAGQVTQATQAGAAAQIAQAENTAAPAPWTGAKAAPGAVPRTVAGAADATEAVEKIDRAARLTVGNDLLDLTWRQYDGALVQAVWRPDGTRFFPAEERDSAGRIESAEFIGVGGAAGVEFQGAPRVEAGGGATTVTFESAAGDRLTYRLPDGGHVLDVEWLSPRGGDLWLIRGLADIPQAADPATGKARPANPLQGLDNGRVFSLEPKKIHAVAWGKVLNDPWFKFLGRERKPLPPALPRLGMDAGFEASKKQTAHYFAAIWDTAQAGATAGPHPRMALGAQPGYVAPVGADGRAAARLYLGPKQAEYLTAFHPEGEPEGGKIFLQTMDFGFFGLIAKLMFTALKLIQGVIPNWGWAIVVFGLLLRLALWPLNTKVTLGMLRQKDLEPHQKKIQEKYAKFSGDMAKKQEMQRELMAFYKKNGHNPMGSCLPMLLQMPIFMALWSMLQNVFELRRAPWVFWIRDLSASDPFFILPAVMVGSMIAQQAMTPPMGDPQQRKMMMVFMPIMMGFFFAYTPAGLTLYYLLYNLVGMGQTWWLMRNHKPRPVVL